MHCVVSRLQQSLPVLFVNLPLGKGTLRQLSTGYCFFSHILPLVLTAAWDIGLPGLDCWQSQERLQQCVIPRQGRAALFLFCALLANTPTPQQLLLLALPFKMWCPSHRLCWVCAGSQLWPCKGTTRDLQLAALMRVVLIGPCFV